VTGFPTPVIRFKCANGDKALTAGWVLYARYWYWRVPACSFQQELKTGFR